MEALNDVVLEPASHFGFETDLWTVGRLRQVIRDHYGVTLSEDTVWRRLRDAGFTFQKPERRYFELNEESREEWLATEAPRIRDTVREFRAILYFQDESNVSLTAFVGKTCWVRCETGVPLEAFAAPRTHGRSVQVAEPGR
jgi:hypothetical protein